MSEKNSNAKHTNHSVYTYIIQYNWNSIENSVLHKDDRALHFAILVNILILNMSFNLLHFHCRVEIPADQIIGSSSQVLLDIEVPLPTVQDEYTALRPYPCDFCSRRFRKKASLLNHMVAHQTDRPHLCKLCGARFLRRQDLINHLKGHAEEQTEQPQMDDSDC